MGPQSLYVHLLEIIRLYIFLLERTAGAYTLLVMVNVMKGGGREPPPPTPTSLG
jgi:hypothetical protein